jgi:hypothetical protein
MINNQAQALHNSRMQEYAQIGDPEKREYMESLENQRYQQFLAQSAAILEQSARIRMYNAQTAAANAQVNALNPINQPLQWATPVPGTTTPLVRVIPGGY